MNDKEVNIGTSTLLIDLCLCQDDSSLQAMKNTKKKKSVVRKAWFAPRNVVLTLLWHLPKSYKSL
jgi:hypothetical protein